MHTQIPASVYKDNWIKVYNMYIYSEKFSRKFNLAWNLIWLGI